MTEKILNFYEPLAEHYHLIYEDWHKAIERQAKILNSLLAEHTPGYPLKILDFACGIGTQTLGLASLGHHVTASDLSRAEVSRAKHEAERLSLTISFHISDMTSLAEITDRDFDVVAALDNALPHLTAEQLERCAAAAGSKLKPNGLFLASIRDYDTLALERPASQAPPLYGGEGDRRIIHQVWDWVDATKYTLHLYITKQCGQTWTTHHFVSEYRCLLRNELSAVLQSNGFREVRWLMPEESGFYQPLVLARRI